MAESLNKINMDALNIIMRLLSHSRYSCFESRLTFEATQLLQIVKRGLEQGA